MSGRQLIGVCVCYWVVRRYTEYGSSIDYSIYVRRCCTRMPSVACNNGLVAATAYIFSVRPVERYFCYWYLVIKWTFERVELIKLAQRARSYRDYVWESWINQARTVCKKLLWLQSVILLKSRCTTRVYPSHTCGTFLLCIIEWRGECFTIQILQDPILGACVWSYLPWLVRLAANALEFRPCRTPY